MSIFVDLNTTCGSWSERRDNDLREGWAWSRLVSDSPPLDLSPPSCSWMRPASIADLLDRLTHSTCHIYLLLLMLLQKLQMNKSYWINNQSSKSSSNPLLWPVPEVSHESRSTCSTWKSSICYLCARPRAESDDFLWEQTCERHS